MRMAIPTESKEQKELFEWAGFSAGAFPELRLLFHIPNGGYRTAITGARMKAEGLKRGVPDLMLPVARGGYHGLFIEMKRVKGGKASDEQKAWLSALRDEGYCAVVCHGWVAAANTLKEYLTWNKTRCD